MKYLIIGGAGFVGANLVRRCLAGPDTEVVVLDSLDPHLFSTTDHLREVWDQISFVHGDLRDEPLLAELLVGCDVVFNCAAQSSHPLSICYPLLDTDINCKGNLTLLEAMRKHNRDAVVVFTSSSTVLGRTPGNDGDEDHAERPLDIYSANKGVAEKYYRIYHTSHDLKTIVLRLPNLYGPYGRGYRELGFVNYCISLAWADKPIKVFGSGEQKRNLLFVHDATEILMKAAREPRLHGEIRFATGDDHLSVREIAQSIVEVFGRGSVVHIDWPDDRRRMEIGDARYTSKRLRDLTGWTPQHDFLAGLRKTRSVLQHQDRQR